MQVLVVADLSAAVVVQSAQQVAIQAVLAVLAISMLVELVQLEQEHLLAEAEAVQVLHLLAQTLLQTTAVTAVQVEVVGAVLPH